MTAEIVNLRQFRKAKARAERASAADANRAKFGRTKGQKAIEEADRQRAEAHLDGARRDDSKEDGETS